MQTFREFLKRPFGRLSGLESFLGGFCRAPMRVRSDTGRHIAATAAAGFKSEW